MKTILSALAVAAVIGTAQAQTPPTPDTTPVHDEAKSAQDRCAENLRAIQLRHPSMTGAKADEWLGKCIAAH